MSTRRSFLQKGLFGGALLALGGTGLALSPTREVPLPSAALEVLSPRAFQVLVAFAGRVVTAANADATLIAKGVDHALSYAAPETQADLEKLLGLFDNALAAALLDQRFRPFSQLDPAAQDRALDEWAKSRLALRRTGYQALRKLCYAAHYTDERSWAALNYAIPTGLAALAYDDSKAGTPEATTAAVEP